MSDMADAERGADLFERWLAHHEGRPLEPVLREPVAQSEPSPGPDPGPDAEPAPQVQPPVAPEPGFPPLPTPEQRGSVPQPAAALGVPERPAALPHAIFFKPRAGTQRLLGMLLLVFVALTGIAAAWAWRDRTYLSDGVTGAAALVTVVVWATRASSAPARLTLHGSELEIVRDGSRARFDLASPNTRIELHGEPGDRGWKVLILRRSMSPYVIDGSMVDPHELTQVLRFYRPEL